MTPTPPPRTATAAAPGREKLALKGHARVVFGVASSPDGKRLVSGSVDMTPRVWDADVPGKTWHEDSARSNEAASSPFAAALHLERLHRLVPHDADVQKRLDTTLKGDAVGLVRFRARHRAFTVALVGTPLALPALRP